SRPELIRYARHLVLPEVGPAGQARLKDARVLLVGAGGLGSPAALYLAAAGVGTLGIVDHDVVDATNLQRQVLHGTSDVGRSKLDSAAETLAEVNPHVRVERHEARLTSENALALLGDYEVVVDGTDNFPTRYLVNDACVLTGRPNVYGSVLRWEGQASVFAAPGGPCYRCLFREPPPPGLVPNCAEGGVLGVLPGIIGSLQALETIKLLLGVGEPLVGRLLIFDALALDWREVRLRRNPECPVCGDEPTQRGLIDYEDFCGLRGGTDAAASAAAPAEGSAGEGAPRDGAGRGSVEEIDPSEAYRLLTSDDPPLLLDVREPHEWGICNLERYGARLVPLTALADQVDTLPDERPVLVYCRSGGRSLKAARLLAAERGGPVLNLRGGILAWAETVDPSLPRY
ncbi:MAG: molybdopterin-synthase adenylyltransferase MoeB, partial [Gemmatimonadetes bacterium]